MPKRDEAYMLHQRDFIARSALEVLIEKGYYQTSQRDICKAAGISTGALYTHFPTKDAVVIAACSLDHVRRPTNPPAQSWGEYVERFFEWDKDSARSAKRFRLSLQFTAELTQMVGNPDGLSAIYSAYVDEVRGCLRHLKDIGTLALPHGLDETTEMHMQMFAGAEYRVASDRDLPPEKAKKALRVALATTAGLIDGI